MLTGTDATSTPRWRVADLTSGLGALVLGVGIGAFFASTFARTSGWILLTGAVAHAWGMVDKHQMERGAGTQPRWATALYWVCWIALAGLAAVIVIR
ncbi:MAG TPA: hypothetical protein VFP91_17705 [Vicinamibacterales bacterium]|nr:hypothetical protein [Vicinamibacterales bacterium]